MKLMRPAGSALERGLLDLCAYVRDELGEVGSIAEVGVWCGESSRLLAAALRPTRLFAVDSWRDDDARMEYHANAAPAIELYSELVTLRGDSVDMARQVPDGSLDLVYIDAGHRYDQVRADIRAWLPKLNARGIMAGHDYAFVSNAGGKRYGVVRAVHEIFFCPDRVFEDFSWLVKRGHGG